MSIPASPGTRVLKKAAEKALDKITVKTAAAITVPLMNMSGKSMDTQEAKAEFIYQACAVSQLNKFVKGIKKGIKADIDRRSANAGNMAKERLGKAAAQYAAGTKPASLMMDMVDEMDGGMRKRCAKFGVKIPPGGDILKAEGLDAETLSYVLRRMSTSINTWGHLQELCESTLSLAKEAASKEKGKPERMKERMEAVKRALGKFTRSETQRALGTLLYNATRDNYVNTEGNIAACMGSVYVEVTERGFRFTDANGKEVIPDRNNPMAAFLLKSEEAVLSAKEGEKKRVLEDRKSLTSGITKGQRKLCRAMEGISRESWFMGKEGPACSIRPGIAVEATKEGFKFYRADGYERITDPEETGNAEVINLIEDERRIKERNGDLFPVEEKEEGTERLAGIVLENGGITTEGPGIGGRAEEEPEEERGI